MFYSEKKYRPRSRLRSRLRLHVAFSCWEYIHSSMNFADFRETNIYILMAVSYFNREYSEVLIKIDL